MKNGNIWYHIQTMTKEQTWAKLASLGVTKGSPFETPWKLRGANLAGAHLSGADLTKADLSDANLSGAFLIKADLCTARLVGANLSNARLHKADLSGVTLSGANLTKADLSEAILRDACFAGADLSGANLSGANLTKVDLRAANLNGADLPGVTLFRAKLERSTLMGTNLYRANLSGANLSGANLIDATLIEANLIKANLTGANLHGAKLTASTLIRANFTEAILTGVSIDYANLTDWIIKDVKCSHIVRTRAGVPSILCFAPLEFEKRYTQLERIAELILNIPLSQSTGFVANAIAQSINRIIGSQVMTVKGIEALSDSDTKLSFVVFDDSFWQRDKEKFETVFEDALNEHFHKNTDFEASDDCFDIIGAATGGLIRLKDKADIPFTPLEVDVRRIENKVVEYYIRMGRVGESINSIAMSVFR